VPTENQSHRGLARRAGRVGIGLLAVGGPLGIIGSWVAPAGATAKPVLRILVTNDDGYAAPGIDAVVQALRALPRTSVVVVAPATNESGSGGKTTPGTITASVARTASGYPAEAVNGFPADTITWAINQHGVPRRPELVVSGSNFGQNIGPLADVSGTVGAARAAAAAGIPALAVSQGIDNSSAPNFAQSSSQAVHWIQQHRSALIKGTFKVAQSAQMNVPTCPGPVRGPVHEPLGTTLTGVNMLQVNCTSTTTKFANDVEAFVNGYAVISLLGKAS
jgi:5'-nucleotidase